MADDNMTPVSVHNATDAFAARPSAAMSYCPSATTLMFVVGMNSHPHVKPPHTENTPGAVFAVTASIGVALALRAAASANARTSTARNTLRMGSVSFPQLTNVTTVAVGADKQTLLAADGSFFRRKR